MSVVGGTTTRVGGVNGLKGLEETWRNVIKVDVKETWGNGEQKFGMGFQGGYDNVSNGIGCLFDVLGQTVATVVFVKGPKFDHIGSSPTGKGGTAQIPGCSMFALLKQILGFCRMSFRQGMWVSCHPSRGLLRCPQQFVPIEGKTVHLLCTPCKRAFISGQSKNMAVLPHAPSTCTQISIQLVVVVPCR
eukprot:scaffold82566_cov63-Attheya_sp.AAC.3